MCGVARDLCAVFIGHMAGGVADLDLLMHIARFRRHVMRAECHADRALAARVERAGVGRQQAAVTADRDLDEVGGLLERLVLEILMDLLHDLFPHDDGRVGLGVGQDDLLRIVVAAPDDTGVVRRIAREPAVKVAGGRAGLAGDGHVFELRGSAGTRLDRRFEHVGDIPRGHVLHGDVGILRIIKDDLPVGVLDDGIGPGLAPDALVGKGRVGRRHGADRHAPGQTAERERPEVDVRELLAGIRLVGGDERGQAHLVLGEGIAVFRRHLRDELDRNGIDRLGHSLFHRHKTAVGRVEVLGPGRRVGEGIGRIVHHGRRGDEAKLDGGRVDRDGLDDGAGREQALRGAVPDKAPLLPAHAASQRDDVAGRIVDDHDAGLQLLGARRGRQALQVFVDRVDRRLHLGVDRGVDLVAAGHDHLVDDVVFVSGLVAQIADDIADDLIFKPGVIIIARVAVIAAAVGEHQFFGHGLVILLLIDITLLEHLGQDDLLPFLVRSGIRFADIGIVSRRVIRDADERRALGQAQVLDVLAEVDAGGRLDALAVFAERNDIEIPLHDILLRVRLFELQCAVDLDQLAADRDLLFAREVLDELLGDGGAAGLTLAEEHLDAGAQRGDPVDALVLFKALILDGDAGVDEIFRDIIVFDPGAVGAAVERLQHLIFPGLGVFVVDDRGLVEREAVCRPLGLLRKVVLHIDRKQAGEDQKRQKCGQKDRPDHLADHREDMACAGLLRSFISFLLSHTDPPYFFCYTGKRRIAPLYIMLSRQL